METKDILKKLRNDKGETLSELSKKVGISQPTLSRYENGTRNPKYDQLERLASHYSVSIDYLTGKTDDPQRPASKGPLAQVTTFLAPFFGEYPSGKRTNEKDNQQDYLAFVEENFPEEQKLEMLDFLKSTGETLLRQFKYLRSVLAPFTSVEKRALFKEDADNLSNKEKQQAAWLTQRVFRSLILSYATDDKETIKLISDFASGLPVDDANESNEETNGNQ